MHIVVATHGHCFDGLASAAVFTRLLSAITKGPVTYSYMACGYGIGQRTATHDVLLGDSNAILDYRFTPSDRVSWYFDHHRTAFATDDDRAFFEAQKSNGRYFFDPAYASCTKLVADVAAKQFGVRDEHLDPLIHWATIVDSAAFSDALQASDYGSPIMQLVSVVEHHGNDAFLKTLVPQLLSQPLIEVASSEAIQRRYEPIGARHERFVSAVKERAQQQGRVVLVDLTDRQMDVLGKFVTYALYPDAVYSVVAARLKRGYKLAIGYNPWCGQPLDTDISAICARYGGGGHQAVGGISLPDDQGERAKAIAETIAQELRTS
jgi:hypothetical protein